MFSTPTDREWTHRAPGALGSTARSSSRPIEQTKIASAGGWPSKASAVSPTTTRTPAGTRSSFFRPSSRARARTQSVQAMSDAFYIAAERGYLWRSR